MVEPHHHPSLSDRTACRSACCRLVKTQNSKSPFSYLHRKLLGHHRNRCSYLYLAYSVNFTRKINRHSGNWWFLSTPSSSTQSKQTLSFILQNRFRMLQYMVSGIISKLLPLTGREQYSPHRTNGLVHALLSIFFHFSFQFNTIALLQILQIRILPNHACVHTLDCLQYNCRHRHVHYDMIKHHMIKSFNKLLKSHLNITIIGNASTSLHYAKQIRWT